PHRAWTASEVELLLREAFHTDVPAADYSRISSAGAEWDDDPGAGRSWVNDLLAHLHKLREYTPPRPYWPARRGAPAEQPVRTVATASQRFADLVGHLHTNGYLARDFAQPCVDEHTDEQGGRDLNAELQQRLGIEVEHPTLWPLKPETWDTDTFYGLIEVFHDLVARPRSRWRHEFNDCGLHFEDFDTDAGRRVYRTLVNRLLAENAVKLRLAGTGEDTGRLVHVVDEARADLIERALKTPDPEVASRVEHAVALFRGRDATEHDKRSAAITLAGILEERRALIRTGIGRKDEGALFGIANEFAIRHQRRGQQSDYDSAFLDWIVWWYLATIELTDRLLARQSANPGAQTPW
ncbi:MAG: hypothetical protein ACRDOY_01900, partial [Nocardioidaceae bacterium]